MSLMTGVDASALLKAMARRRLSSRSGGRHGQPQRAPTSLQGEPRRRGSGYFLLEAFSFRSEGFFFPFSLDTLPFSFRRPLASY
jgi:hypothetical protein